MDAVQIIIGGDIVPTESNLELFNSGDIEALIGGDLVDLLNGCDIRIFNLEVPLADHAAPIPKCGPPLIAPTSTVRGLKALNPSLIALANNHILDQGEQGLKSTVSVLKENGIPYVGAGSRLAEASRPYIIERGGLRIGVYACAEQEFSIATDTTAGANPFDPLESLDHIAALKAESDHVIVLYHGGKEHYRYPSPYLQKVCRKIVQKGADLVVCQHSHCIGCYEEYQGSTIVYGQGNFIFDLTESEFWQTSLLLKVSFGDIMAVEYIPICKRGKSVELPQANVKAEILEQFRQRSAQISEEGFIKGQYKLFAEGMNQKYLNSLAGHGVWIQRIDKRLFGGQLIKQRYNMAKKLMLRNYIECEAHRELLIEGLRGESTVK
jgi:poly-gamma-glutamate synthesis protein (capsule biosynthesis protein)